MFEEIIAALEELGVEYTEDYDAGSLTIDIADIDKSNLIAIISTLNSLGEMFEITDTEIVVNSTLEMQSEEEAEDTEMMMDEDALNEMLGQQ